MACSFPFLVQNPNPSGLATIPVPCGRCYDCRLRSVNQWIFRLQQEEKRSTSSYFVTLTYSTQHVPITPHGYMTLDYSDVQKFWKRLRKLPTSTKLKYFVVGEYGSKKMRPHYHAIVLNAVMSDVLLAWNLGDVHFGGVTAASIAYTLKYMMKDSVIPKHSKDDRAKEFRKMSKGLGANYLTDAIHKFHNERPNDLFIPLVSGHVIALPRYYRLRLFSDQVQKDQIRDASVIMSQIRSREEEKHEQKVKKGTTNVSILEDYERIQSDYRNKKAIKLANDKRRDF